MVRIRTLLLVAAAVAAACIAPSAPAGAQEGEVLKPSWDTDISQAVAKATKNKQAIILWFQSPASDEEERAIFHEDDFQEPLEEEQVRFVRITYKEKDHKIAEEWNIRKFPAVLVLDWHGNEMQTRGARQEGRLKARNMVKAFDDLEKYVERMNEVLMRRAVALERAVDKDEPRESDWEDILPVAMELAAFKGYEGGDKARALVRKAEEVAKEMWDDAYEATLDGDRDTAKSIYYKIAKKFKGLEIAEKAEDRAAKMEGG